MQEKKGINDFLNASREKNETQKGFNWSLLTKNICIICLVGTTCYKIGDVEIDKTVDLSTLLSLALALFSIFISFQFYFKTTETSNKFYDNTYKFTKDISEILVKIESGFGEKLDYINRYMQNGHNISEFREEKKEIKEDISEKDKERDRFVESIVKKLNESEDEKKNLLAQYKEIEREKEHLSERLEELRRQRNTFLYNDRILERPRIHRIVTTFTKNKIIPELLADDYESFEDKVKHFAELTEKGGPKYIQDLESLEYWDNDELTPKGYRWLHRLVENAQQL
ncbi:hypothetical protein [Mailhella sp.]